MAGEAIVQVDEGTGKKLHGWQRDNVSGNNVIDEIVVLGEPYPAGYATTTPTGGISIATANSHVVEWVAGANLNLYIRRIMIYQVVLATAAAISEWQLWSLTTAGTGGTVQTIYKLDSTDAAAGLTAMTLPTVKGTESNRLWTGAAMVTQTVPTAGGDLLMFDLDFDKMLRGKPPRVPAGVANGITIKNVSGNAAATVAVTAYISELAY